jgi:sugar (pentulose or hexulose) kinase
MDLAFFASSCGDEGAITHMREAELTVGHLFRAAFQNMAGNYARCAERLRPIGAWDGLVFSGGLARKLPLLRRIVAEALQREYRLCPEQEDTLFGLLALGLAYTGRAASVQEAMTGLGTAFGSLAS